MYYLLKKINCMCHLFCIIVLTILINHKLQIESMLIRFCLLKFYSDGLNCKSKTGRMSLHYFNLLIFINVFILRGFVVVRMSMSPLYMYRHFNHILCLFICSDNNLNVTYMTMYNMNLPKCILKIQICHSNRIMLMYSHLI